MFLFGIFTTHIPYIAFVLFYAYFLLFNVENTNSTSTPVAEQSIQLQQHTATIQATAVSAFHIQQELFAKLPQQLECSIRQINQQWKWCQQHSLHPQIFVDTHLFCRPPPAWV